MRNMLLADVQPGGRRCTPQLLAAHWRALFPANTQSGPLIQLLGHPIILLVPGIVKALLAAVIQLTAHILPCLDFLHALHEFAFSIPSVVSTFSAKSPT